MLRLYPKSLFMRFSEHYPKMIIGQASLPLSTWRGGAEYGVLKPL